MGDEVRPGKYRHIKGGLYDVLGVAKKPFSDEGSFEFVGVAKYTEDPDLQFIIYRFPCSPPFGSMFYRSMASFDRSVLEKSPDRGLGDLVVYWSLDEKGGRKEFWARTKTMFTENVIKDGERVPRFRHVGDLE